MFQLTRKRTLVGLGVAAVAVMGLNGCMRQNGAVNTIALAGSDTTQEVMGAISSNFNADTSNGDHDVAVNILAQETSPHTVAGDANCATKTYHTPPSGTELNAPNGSGAGRDALKASVLAGDGCIDIARSSGTPRAVGTDLASFEYYAFGLDAVGWASASANAPANLTLAQLQGIYNCTFTDWSAVGGAAGPIQRYWPQASSGTKTFFQTEVLGFDPLLFSSGSCPAPKITEENTGLTIATNGDQAKALVPHSAGNWVAQARGTAPDLRNGLTIRQLNGQALVVFPGGVASLNTAGPVVESNVKLNNPTPAFPGIRYVFNVIDNTSVGYGDAKFFVGFENLSSGTPTASALCNNGDKSTIENFGFAALDKTTGPHNLMGSNCREFTP